ncbi:hypothetical protein N7582_002366 [Saccharomyces uvarum]|uniref:Large ribosomal subunit protein uL3m n=1 Tax=Saccharomyces uvarum TaxID=230603 RepID=A0AA35JKS8_SACUV|nr:hypothetical protein N7582_002366 [Saccharomyces uvarum]CAI4063274.1 hypothetical protein SUVC_07G4460 [Saccharomyces uvarum]
MSKFLQGQIFNISKCYVRHSSTRPFLVAPSIAKSITTEAPPINHSPELAQTRKWLPERCGLITRKKGMMPYFDQSTGERTAATILEVNNVEVIMHRTPDANGYFACQVGFGSKHLSKVTRQMLGHFASKVVNPKEYVSEFRVKNDNGLLPPGTLLKPSFFKEGQYVDVKSVSKGKGFTGVMKRYGFKGLRASHGTSIMHRHGGSYGQNQDPGRVLPGRKMPGHMGNDNVTIQNVKILKVDDENNVIWVKGPVAGPKNTFVKIQDAIKKT